ncbi:MAG: phenylalanine--tRNA ligase subunit alpha, partial [Candidatus Rokuibacteriota bacterium]
MGHPRVDAIVQQAREAVAAAQSSAELERIRVSVLGRQGELTQLLRSLGTLTPEERPLAGAAANEAKRELEALLAARLAATLEAERQA